MANGIHVHATITSNHPIAMNFIGYEKPPYSISGNVIRKYIKKNKSDQGIKMLQNIFNIIPKFLSNIIFTSLTMLLIPYTYDIAKTTRINKNGTTMPDVKKSTRCKICCPPGVT